MLNVYILIARNFTDSFLLYLPICFNNIIVYLSNTFYFIVDILGLQTQYCVFLIFKHSLFAHIQLYIFLKIFWDTSKKDCNPWVNKMPKWDDSVFYSLLD